MQTLSHKELLKKIHLKAIHFPLEVNVTLLTRISIMVVNSFFYISRKQQSVCTTVPKSFSVLGVVLVVVEVTGQLVNC